jgi:hypothetical protein
MPTCSLQIFPSKILHVFLTFSIRTKSSAQLIILEMTPLNGEEHTYVSHEISLQFKKTTVTFLYAETYGAVM